MGTLCLMQKIGLEDFLNQTYILQELLLMELASD